MIKKNTPLEIKSNNIFLNDKLNRKSEVENLSNLIAATKTALTISINADWGRGKTTFVKLWKEHLQENHGIKSIYFSAWEDDFSKEPLISILGEINKYIENNFKNENEIKEKFEKVKKLGAKVIKRGLPAFIKGVTSGLLDIDQGFESAIGAITEETTKQLIEKYSEEKKLTQTFKETVSDLLSLIDKDKPFVIFIDELDRCRPLYAIELLERIKHIFGVDGLIFVLSIDKKQLSESIKSQYGNIDTVSYLRRFIELEYQLREVDKEHFCNHLYKYFDIGGTIGIKIRNPDLAHLNILKYLVNSLDLTLREIEQAFIQINIVFKTMPHKLTERYFMCFIFFIILKTKREDLYFGLINKTISREEILDSVLHYQNNQRIKHSLIIIKAIVYVASVKNHEELEQLIRKEDEKLEEIPKNTNEYFQQMNLNGILYNEMGSDELSEIINTAIKKIEFADDFNLDRPNNE